MSRLWEKGLPLDERVLRYTAGEDHQLDARLVEYDVRGSIAHAKSRRNWGERRFVILSRSLQNSSRR